MTKAELVEFVKEKAKLRKTETVEAVNAVIEGIKDALGKGDKVQLVGFGTFEVRQRAARTGRNPQDPKKIVEIPAKKVPVFRAGKMLRAVVDVPVAAPKKKKKVAAPAAPKVKK